MKNNLIYKIILFLHVFIICNRNLNAQNTHWDKDIIELDLNYSCNYLMSPKPIYSSNWHELPQTIFWKKIITLSPDTFLINIASNRQIIEKIAFVDWHKKSEDQKKHYKDSIRFAHNLSNDEVINVTSGKNDFYKIKEVSSTISQGILEFQKLGVDPWYAQAILLIESPAQLKKSSAGAYGAFQLMPDVARAQGLIVNSKIDERANFQKSAYGAAKLISRVCIPSARKILQSHNIEYNENEIWFRLLVMHIYHAGAQNISLAINKINPTEGGQQLIQKLWMTKAGSFGNSSQNYSQVALATQIVLDELLNQQRGLITQ